MIEFNGNLTGKAKKHYIKRLMNSGSLCMIFMFSLTVPFWLLFGHEIGRIFETVVLLLVTILLMPLLLRLFITKKEKDRMNLKKVTISSEFVKAYSENIKTKNKISKIKKIIDYGEYYDIVFPGFYFTSMYVCQKDLISKGSIKDFEKMWP